MKSILNLLSIREYIMGGISLLFAGVVHGQNPIVQTCYTTDPAPMVHDGTLYVYTGHDEDKADFFWMQEWRVYSTKDMVNWTDHGSPLAIESFDWADDRAWAAQCIEHNGKFYWYVCLRSKLTNTMAIGVAVGDSPLGPFKDAIGKPLYDGSWDFIDPTVFVDDDGQAYLYWGNPNIYYVKLNDDMISLKGEVRKMEQTIESFGAQPRSFHMRQQGVVDDFAFSIETDQHFQLTAKPHGNSFHSSSDIFSAFGGRIYRILYSVYFLHLLLGDGVIVEARNHRTYGIAQGLCIGLRNGLLRQFVYISQQRYGDCGNARKYQQHILQG